MPPGGPPVRKATASDVQSIAGALARSFHEDPVFRWIYRDGARRRKALPAFFSLFAEMLLRHVETYTVGQCIGAALWARPGQPVIPEVDAEEFGLRVAQLSGPDAERAVAVSKVIDEHHPPGSYYFLQFMGVEPERQGQGIGSALMAPVLERCDREGVRAYLDATSPRNKALYERHGFRSGDEFAPEGGPPLWPMWREPSA